MNFDCDCTRITPQKYPIQIAMLGRLVPKNQKGYATRCARQLMLILNLFNLFISFMSPFSFEIHVLEPMAAIALFFEKS